MGMADINYMSKNELTRREMDSNVKYAISEDFKELIYLCPLFSNFTYFPYLKVAK